MGAVPLRGRHRRNGKVAVGISGISGVMRVEKVRVRRPLMRTVAGGGGRVVAGGTAQVHMRVTDPDCGRRGRVEPRRVVGVISVRIRRRKDVETTDFVVHRRLLVALLL